MMAFDYEPLKHFSCPYDIKRTSLVHLTGPALMIPPDRPPPPTTTNGPDGTPLSTAYTLSRAVLNGISTKYLVGCIQRFTEANTRGMDYSIAPGWASLFSEFGRSRFPQISGRCATIS
jgi:hypothetical protein